MKSTSYLFMIDGAFLEVDSMLEIRSGVTDEEWEAILSSTVGYYCLMAATNKHAPMSKKDVKIMKMLKRTVNALEGIDKVGMVKYDIKEIIAKHVKGIEEYNNVQEMMSKPHDNGKDHRIIVKEI